MEQTGTNDSREVYGLTKDGRTLILNGIDMVDCTCGCEVDAFEIPRINQLIRFAEVFKSCNSFTFIENGWIPDTLN